MRYCQHCASPQVFAYWGRPCMKCGSMLFGEKPAPTHVEGWKLTRDDKVFLKVQKIDPENE